MTYDPLCSRRGRQAASPLGSLAANAAPTGVDSDEWVAAVKAPLWGTPSQAASPPMARNSTPRGSPTPRSAAAASPPSQSPMAASSAAESTDETPAVPSPVDKLSLTLPTAPAHLPTAPSPALSHPVFTPRSMAAAKLGGNLPPRPAPPMAVAGDGRPVFTPRAAALGAAPGRSFTPREADSHLAAARSHVAGVDGAPTFTPRAQLQPRSVGNSSGGHVEPSSLPPPAKPPR